MKEKFAAIAAAISLATAALGLGTAAVQHNEKKIEVEKRKAAEEQLVAANAEVARTRNAQIDHEKTSLYTFSTSYNRYVQNFHVAVGDYVAKRGPATEQQLVTTAQALVHFVESWRAVQAPLAQLLDGHIDSLKLSLAGRDYDSVAAAERVIYATASDKLPVLDKQLESLRWAK